jgi:hypothetical protein
MKLFQRLLVAPAALGLLAPLSAIASEVNLNVISNYSDGEFEIDSNSFNNSPVISPLLAGGEGMVDDHDHSSDSFSETTTASFSADMYLGAVDGGSSTSDDAINATYSFQIDLTTSFTGEDSLDVSIDAGTSGAAGTAEFDGNTAGDGLTVDGLAYTFPLGDKTTAFVGDNVDGSLLFNTACVYGGPSNTLDACGNVNSAIDGGAGTAAGASFEIGNGFTGAIGYTGAGTTTGGVLTKEGNDSYAGQVSYAADSYGASVTYANVEGNDDTVYWGLNGYWTPSDSGSMPSVSVGYEMGNPTTAKDNTSYFVGLQWDEVGPGTFGAALGTKTPTIDGGDPELLMYEAFYSYAINDGMTITPLVYIKEFATGTDDETGVMVKSSFSF